MSSTSSITPIWNILKCMIVKVILYQVLKHFKREYLKPLCLGIENSLLGHHLVVAFLPENDTGTN